MGPCGLHASAGLGLMPKLPVFDIVRQTYRFLIEERWTILRLSWFLLLITALLQVAVEYADIQQAIAANSGSRGSQSSYLSMFIVGMAQALALVAVAVALHRTILFGDRREGTRLYIALGKVEILFLLLSLATVGFAVLAVLPLIPVIMWTDFTPSMEDGLSNAIATAVFYSLVVGSFAFFSTRLSPVLPIAVIERHLRFREPWQLTRGNFWRLFWIGLLGSLPLMIVFGGADAYLGDPSEELGFNAGREAILSALQEKRDLLPVRAAISYLSNLISGAVGVGLLCYSYKALKGYAFDELLTESRPAR